jgi:oligoribonuclease
VRQFDLPGSALPAPADAALERHFHYRNLDVSTVKELARRWSPEVLASVRKASAHTALSDVRDSIAELRHYRRYMGALSGLPAA